MFNNILNKLENPERPLLGPNVKALEFWGLLLPDNFWKKCFYMSLNVLLIIFAATQCIDVWYVKSDMNLLLNNLKTTMLATMSAFKVTTFLYWQKYWKNIIEYVTKADLYQRTTSNEKKNGMINVFTKYARKITYLYGSLMYTTVIILIAQPIIKYFASESYREAIKNGTGSYEPVISSWVPFDKNNLVGYLAASVYQSCGALYGGGWITSFDTNAIVIMVFFKAELKLIKEDCTEIFGDELMPVDEETVMNKLKDCHRRHVELVKYARLFDSCLSSIMLLYAFVCSIMLCVTAYQITGPCKLVDFIEPEKCQESCLARIFQALSNVVGIKIYALAPLYLIDSTQVHDVTLMCVCTVLEVLTETSATQRFLTAEYLVFGVAQLFIYCWHSNDVLIASQDIIRGPYYSTWYARGLRYRKDLYILTAQLNKDVVFSVGPFTFLTLATFISILKGAYSYYTLLSNSI